MSSPAPPRIAILGGGITGLAAAHRLTELLPAAPLALFEANSKLGGVLETVQRGEYLVERSADMFTTREPWALELCRRIGIADELIGTDARYRKALIVFRGRLYPVPDGFQLMSPSKLWPMARSPLLSLRGKLRMAWEYFRRRKQEEGDESLASFVRRRLGTEAFDRLVQPLVGGIYTADPERLSMAATLPQFLEMEQRHGGLLRAMFNAPPPTEAVTNDQGSGARYGQFLAPRLGMTQLIDAIAARLPSDAVRLSTRVASIVREGSGWRLQLSDGAWEAFDAVIYALPAYTHLLLAQADAELAALIAKIEHASCSMVLLGYKRSQVSHPLNAFGFVAPAIEHRQIIAGSMASVKFAGRAPSDRVLFRVFIGGALHPELANLPNEELLSIARRELGELLGVQGEPEFHDIARWRGVMPQYHVGHLDLVARIDARVALMSGLALAGNAYRGVGIPFCVRSGEQAAERIARQFSSD